MPRVTLAALMLALGSLTLLIEGGPRTTAEPFVRVNGPPAFTAESVQVSRGRLIVTGLREAEPRGRFAGRVLLYGEGDDGLVLWLAVVRLRMEQANPLAGHEGPGRSFETALQEDRHFSVRLGAPLEVRLVSVDGGGVVRRDRRARVTQIELSD